MMLNLMDDIRPITELKRDTRTLLNHLHKTGRPVVLTVNGKANSVILDVEVFVKYVQAMNLAKLLAEAEADIQAGNTQNFKEFFAEFKHDKKISD